MNLRSDTRQKNTQQNLDFHSAPTGETWRATEEGTESLPTVHTPENPASTNQLMEEICERKKPEASITTGEVQQG